MFAHFWRLVLGIASISGRKSLSKFVHDLKVTLNQWSVTASDLQKLVRDHWQIENSLHFVKDRWWDEDRHYLSRPGLGEVFATLTNFALSVLRLLQQPGDSLVETPENLRYAPRKSLQLIGIEPN